MKCQGCNSSSPFKSHISSNIDGYPTTISSVSIVSIVKPAVVRRFPISRISANGDTCGEIPPHLSPSASCIDDLA